MEDEKKTYIEDIDFLLEEMQNPDYFCRIFTCSDNGRPQTLIKSKVTPVSEEDLEELIYSKGIEEADNFFIVLYADTKGKEKLFGGRLWLNPRPKNMNKKKQNLSGDYNQQYNPMTFYESGVNNTMKLVKEMQEGYNQSLDKIVAVMKEQETERKQLAEELKKTYQKQVKEDKASENGAGIMNLLGSFAPVLAQGLMNGQNNQQQNQNIAGFQQRPPNIPANAIPINNISAINKIIDDRNKDNNNNEN